ncbi:MAG: type II toxin-antitoxin system RelE/ParE family toxin [Bacteroidota bacterium]
MHVVLIHSGTVRKISAIAIGKDVPIYQDELFPQIDEKTKHRIQMYIKFISDRRFPVENTSISKKLIKCGNLYELRPMPVRLFFFMLGNNAVITHGFIKKKNTTDKTEIKRAIALRDRCLKEE